MDVKRIRRWCVGGVLSLAALSGGTVAASSYPPGDPTPSTVAAGGQPGGIRNPPARRRTGRHRSRHRHDPAHRRGRRGHRRRPAGQRTVAAALGRRLISCTAAWSDPASACASRSSPPSPRSLPRSPRRSRPDRPSSTPSSSPPARRSSCSSARWRRGGSSPWRPGPPWRIAADPVLMAPAAVALAAALWVGATRRDRPDVLAVAIGLTLNVFARAELDAGFGTSAFISLAAIALLLLAGFVRSTIARPPGRADRRRRARGDRRRGDARLRCRRGTVTPRSRSGRERRRAGRRDARERPFRGGGDVVPRRRRSSSPAPTTG